MRKAPHTCHLSRLPAVSTKRFRGCDAAGAATSRPSAGSGEGVGPDEAPPQGRKRPRRPTCIQGAPFAASFPNFMQHSTVVCSENPPRALAPPSTDLMRPPLTEHPGNTGRGCVTCAGAASPAAWLMAETSTCSCPEGSCCALRLCSCASAFAMHAQMPPRLPAASRREALNTDGTCGRICTDVSDAPQPSHTLRDLRPS